MRGAYPGTFDPPTIAHLAIAEAARRQCELSTVELILNPNPLGKSNIRALETRLAMLEAVASKRPWLQVSVTNELHIADIAQGYDVLVMGADKWSQVLDPDFYASVEDRDAAVARLPPLAIAPRHDFPIPDGCVLLDIDLSHVSSTEARAGRPDLVLPEALPFL